MNLNLSGKNAIVGGASQGIGKASAIELAALGANVTIISRSEEALQSVVKELDTNQGQQHYYLVADFSDSKTLLEKVNTHLQKTLKVCHILVNNTGGPAGGPIVKADTEAFTQAYHNHLICNHLLAQAVLSGMKEAGYGRIINITSTSVKEPLSGLGVSNTTRWAVAAWAKTWANEVGRWGITVNTVLPGSTSTQRLFSIIDARAAKNNTTSADVEKQMRQTVPLARFAKPAEIACAVAFLASPAASYITGIVLPVDGGRTKSL